LFFCYVSLLAVAEETLAEFLSKATGTAVDWVQMIGMKVSYQLFKNSIAIACSYFCNIFNNIRSILMFLFSLVRILLVSLLFLAIVVG
jgi:hypothetical protein